MNIALRTLIFSLCLVTSLSAAVVGRTLPEKRFPLSLMVELNLGGQRIEGMPLVWDRWTVCLLGRDGRLWQSNPAEAADYRKTSDRFEGYSAVEMRVQLQREFDSQFEITATRHFLIAHPRGQRDKWPPRFEELYRSFSHYFSVRGFQLQEPGFPLIGIVLGNEEAFRRYVQEQDITIPSDAVGVYHNKSNRIALYDSTAGEDSTDWQQNAAVIIHEATHQAAFNTGIHSRYSVPPLWVIEGLATMFEAPGVHQSRTHRQLDNRINQGRLREFRQHAEPKHEPELLVALISSDKMFKTDTIAAYAEAWALTFFLMETRPRQYAEYLKQTIGRKPFTEYTAAERMSDFTEIFGDNWPMFEARFSRFVAQLK